MRKLHIINYLYAILAAIIIQGCVTVPSDVVMPQWDTNLNIPFATKNYTLNDILKSQNYISISAAQDSTYIITSDTYSQSQGISNFIKVTTGQTIANQFVPTDGSEVEVLLPFPEGAELDSAVFVSGTMTITGHNNSANTPATITIRVPGISNNGNPLVLSVTVPVKSSNTTTRQLNGYVYKEPAVQFFKGFDIIAKATGGTGQVTFDANSSDFVFSSVTGYLPTKTLGSQSNNFSLNLGDASKYRDKVFLKTATLTMTGNYKSPAAKPFVIKVNNFKVQGVRNNTSTPMDLTFNSSTVDSFRFDANGNFVRNYTETNSNITQFITFLPGVIKISADYVMNPDNSKEYRTATNADTVFFKTNFSTKSLLAVQQTSFVDTLKLDISQDERDQILKGQGVSATANIQNAIPLTAWVKVTLTDEHYQPLFVVTKDAVTHADSIKFLGATVDAAGNVLHADTSNAIVTLDSTQITKLANFAHYAFVSVTVSTSGTNNAPVLVRAKDWIKLNVFGRVTYRIKGDK